MTAIRSARASQSRRCAIGTSRRPRPLVLGRKGTPKKASTLPTDRSRLDAHVRPLLGPLKANEVTRADIEQFKQAVVLGKTARDEKLGPRRRSIVKGGKGTLTRTLGLLGAIFVWAGDNGYVDHDPVRGVRRFTDAQKKALLTIDQHLSNEEPGR